MWPLCTLCIKRFFGRAFESEKSDKGTCPRLSFMVVMTAGVGVGGGGGAVFPNTQSGGHKKAR